MKQRLEYTLLITHLDYLPRKSSQLSGDVARCG